MFYACEHYWVLQPYPQVDLLFSHPFVLTSLSSSLSVKSRSDPNTKCGLRELSLRWDDLSWKNARKCKESFGCASMQLKHMLIKRFRMSKQFLAITFESDAFISRQIIVLIKQTLNSKLSMRLRAMKDETPTIVMLTMIPQLKVQCLAMMHSNAVDKATTLCSPRNICFLDCLIQFISIWD